MDSIPEWQMTAEQLEDLHDELSQRAEDAEGDAPIELKFRQSLRLLDRLLGY